MWSCFHPYCQQLGDMYGLHRMSLVIQPASDIHQAAQIHAGDDIGPGLQNTALKAGWPQQV